MSSNSMGNRGQISMLDALSQVESRTLKDRSTGLADLRHILQHNRENPELNNFDDKSFHKIFEVLFVLAGEERSNYFKSLSSTSEKVKANAINRFTNCSQTLRLAVERGARNIRLKTLKALLDHLLETLLDANGSCCELIALDYARCLSATLAYEPHVEHLKVAQWRRVVRFCTERLAFVAPLDEHGVSSFSKRSIISSSHAPSTTPRMTSTGERLPKQAIDEFVKSLRHLTDPPSAPVIEDSEMILTTMLKYIQNSQSAGQAQVNALAALNNVLSQARAEKIQLTTLFIQPCVQMARNVWHSKLFAIKNEILIMLVMLHPYIKQVLIRGENPSLQMDVEAMVETLTSEYAKRDAGNQLRMDDVRLGSPAETSYQGLSFQVFSLRDGTASATNSPDGEHNWTLLRLLAIFSIHDAKEQRHRSESPDPVQGGARKRVRLSHWSDELLRATYDSHIPTRMTCIQLICFAAQVVALRGSVLERVVERLSVLCNDDNGLTASWALLALASCANQAAATAMELSRAWSSAWHLAARLANSGSTCRASCHLMHTLMRFGLVERSTLLDSCDSMVLTIEVNGPYSLSDSVAAFLTTVVGRLQQENLPSSKDGAERILTWLFRTWAPSNFRDRVFTTQNNNTEPLDILDLINACLGRQVDRPPLQHLPTLGPVAQAWILHAHNCELVNYLLLVESLPPFLTEPPQVDGSSVVRTNASSNVANESLVFGLSAAEVTRTIEQLTNDKDKRGNSMNSDMVRSISTLFIVAECLSRCHDIHDTRRANQLFSSNESLQELLFHELSSPSCEQRNVDTCLEVFATCMIFSTSQHDDDGSTKHHCMSSLSGRVHKLLISRRNNTESSGLAQDDDSDDGIMDIDTQFMSQPLSQSRNSTGADYPRKLIQNGCHIVTQKIGIAMYATLMRDDNPSEKEIDMEEAALARVTTYLVHLDDSDLLASHTMISALHEHVGHFSPEQTRELMNRILDGPLRLYEYERCETTHAFLLEVMLRQIRNWTDATNVKLFNDGIDLYSWLTDTALNAKMLSSFTQKSLCGMLLELLQIDPDYGEKEDMPSIRTTLFSMLQNAKLEVGHYLAERMSSIFDLYTLSKHDEVFDDLNSSLPTDIEWTEGIAIRLLALAHLASNWPSLLRRCIYGIFDTAGQIDTSTGYATRCVFRTSKMLDLQSPRDLFKLFAAQLLFTWIDVSRPVAKVPYEIFGYETLMELVEQNTGELYAQLVIRDDLESIKWLTKTLRTTEEKILRATFPKVVAYAMSWDIIFDKGSQHVCETHLRNLIKAKSEYQSLAVANFPQIVAQMYISLDQDESAEKALEKKPKFSYASDVLKAIKSYSSSDRILPCTQQPHFKAKYLPDQMERAVRRASASSQQELVISQELTSPALTIVLRSLIDTMHPALGPLHACQILRKLRLLIAFAGENALQGYPLEMLLRTIIPLAVDPHCADDSIGILHYLFHKGKPYLKDKISSLTSISLLLLLSMKSFMVSRQDRTTQESQFRSTVSKMQSFHDWLLEYLLGCKDVFVGKDDARKAIFTRLIEACRDLSLPASADVRSPASLLLQAVIDDEQSKVPVLGKTERKQVISLLCRRFETPASTSQDILGSDSKSIEYAKCIWSTTRSLLHADEYEAWAARVVGRAFAASVNPKLVRPKEPFQAEYIDPASGESHSIQAIVARLRGLLLSENRAAVAVAESALRKMIAGFMDAQDHTGVVGLESLLPTHIVEAMAPLIGHQGSATSLGQSSLVSKTKRDQLSQAAKCSDTLTLVPWVRNLAVKLCEWVSNSPIVTSLSGLLEVVEDSATQTFPFIVHLALQAEQEKEAIVRSVVSECFTAHFSQLDIVTEDKLRLMLGTILYLLTQPRPQERTMMDRLLWLDVDYVLAAKAATHCNMPTAALYLVELTTSPSVLQSADRHSLYSSVNLASKDISSNELLLKIYKTVDDPDSFYGVQQAPSLQSVMDRVDHERDGLKGMMLHSAHMDASLRRIGHAQKSDSQGILRSVGAMNFNSLTQSLLSQSKGKENDDTITETMLESARKLQQWDIVPPKGSASNSAVLYSVCKSMSTASSLDAFKVDLRNSMRSAHRKLQEPQLSASLTRSTLSMLAILTEIDELTTVRSVSDLSLLWESMQSRQKAWDIGRSDDAQHIVSYRETFFGILSRNHYLRESLHVGIKDSRTIEVKAVVSQSEFARKHDLIQQSLAAATYLSELVPSCEESGMRIDGVAQFEAASILWRQGEISSSVQMLQALRQREDLDEQAVRVGSAGLLAQLGHEIAVGRLEKPEEIISQYLKPAIAQLGSTKQGSEAGRVFFEFASFCDQQLQNTGNVEDFQRLERLSQRRAAELQQWSSIIKSTPSSQKDKKKSLRQAESKAQQWFNLDDQEYQKARRSRDDFVRQSLENYLRALQACDDSNPSVVRFFALWLEHSDSQSANDAVQQVLQQVPSWKFVGLTNQLTSRLQNDDSPFQKTLAKLVIRMCVEHPFHMVYNIYAGASSNVSSTDETGTSRKKAATTIKDYIRAHKVVGNLISRIWQSCHGYVKLAHTKINPPSRNQRLTLDNVKIAGEVDKLIRRLSVPPATLQIDLRPDADYQNIPLISRFRSEIKIAGGLSAPKILTAVGTDGKEYKQLFKGGNDDLRQDAIMEQVFGEVSKMLQNHKATRQRSIHIRTYKVLPLTANTGIIEFVRNSLPLAEFLNPAHARYYPGDMKADQARLKIGEASKLAKEVRYRAYKEVTAHFQPVLRHFFFERFSDPDDWFERRLAYTRSTAAISMLGYVLGLGDRHTQNILLDEKSGEVIHIDLGVAFEAGRVLPIPEVVPFRMTRDIVDGMGITKTEGVFRRCCEFTMEALREETDGIMTLLNVLRYDPLYTWTLSPLRAKRIQEAQEETEDRLEALGSKKGEDEAGEADRALSIVEKKLSKTLSVAATVNELIQQATDERNLAVLFQGWAAYA